MDVPIMPGSYIPGDPMLVDNIVWALKSQGIFDSFRKECIADVDTKPAYQNLRQRVETSVASFLKKQQWRPDLNKNQLREQLRRHITESGFMEPGVERIVDQVVNPKMNTVFHPKIAEVVYNYLGLEKPDPKTEQEREEELKVKSEELLPEELEAVSPESRHDDDNNDEGNVSLDSMKVDDDESPPFEPLDDDNSMDSHMSGISGLASHDSNPSPKMLQIDESQMSRVSSENVENISNDDGKEKSPSLHEQLLTAQGKTEESSAPVVKQLESSESDLAKSEGDSNSSQCLKIDLKLDDEKQEKRDRDRDRHRSDRTQSPSSKSDRRRESSSSRKDKYRDRDRDRRDSKSTRDKDRDRHKSSSSSRHSTNTSSSSGSSAHRDTRRDSSSSRRDSSKPHDTSSKSKSTSSSRSRHDKNTSSSSHDKDRDREKRDRYKDNKKDDHYGAKTKSEYRRPSTDRDSNDGSGLKSSRGNSCDSTHLSQSTNVQKESSNSNDSSSGTSNQHSDSHESKRSEKRRRSHSRGHDEYSLKSRRILDSEDQREPIEQIEIRPKTPPAISVSAASWDALEAQLTSKMKQVCHEFYDSDEASNNMSAVQVSTSCNDTLKSDLMNDDSPKTDSVKPAAVVPAVDLKPQIEENEVMQNQIEETGAKFLLQTLEGGKREAQYEKIPMAVDNNLQEDIMPEFQKDDTSSYHDPLEIEEEPLSDPELVIDESLRATFSPPELRYFDDEDVERDQLDFDKSVEYLERIKEQARFLETITPAEFGLLNNVRGEVPPTTITDGGDAPASRSYTTHRSLLLTARTTPPDEVEDEQDTSETTPRNNNLVGKPPIHHPPRILAQDEDFHLPLSPSESDSDREQQRRVGGRAAGGAPRRSSGNTAASQRYSSDDLYKPRPVFKRNSTRRRGQVETDDN